MTTPAPCLTIIRAGPLCSLQDLGRPGQLQLGLSQGGAADISALFDAAALLGADRVLPAIEMAAMGGEFTANAPLRIALTGAPMRATLDGQALAWNATHVLKAGARLVIGAGVAGVYGYLTCAGGLIGPDWLGSVSTHFNAGIGGALRAGQMLTVAPDPTPDAAQMSIPAITRFDGGTIRIMPGPQTGLFSQTELTRFQETVFTRDATANRQGARLLHDTDPFPCKGGSAGLASDFVAPGDVQMTGTGIPYVLMAECQSMGGYPRIGTVVGADLPLIAQAPVGAALRFTFVSVAQADALETTPAAAITARLPKLKPLVRDVHKIPDLLSYQLIGGVVSATRSQKE